MDLAQQQRQLAGARDNAVRNLRDLTIAVGVIAAGAVGLFAWVSAATIPGTTGKSGLTGGAADASANQPITPDDQAFGQAQPGSVQFGSPVAVSGGSR